MLIICISTGTVSRSVVPSYSYRSSWRRWLFWDSKDLHRRFVKDLQKICKKLCWLFNRCNLIIYQLQLKVMTNCWHGASTAYSTVQGSFSYKNTSRVSLTKGNSLGNTIMAIQIMGIGDHGESCFSMCYFWKNHPTPQTPFWLGWNLLTSKREAHPNDVIPGRVPGPHCPMMLIVYPNFFIRNLRKTYFPRVRLFKNISK